MINNSRFESSKFNLNIFLILTFTIKRLAWMFCFKVWFLSKHFCFFVKASRSIFSPLFPSSSRCWHFRMTSLFYKIFQHGTGSLLWYRLHPTFILYTNIPWDGTSKLYGGQISCYMIIMNEEELWICFISREVPRIICTKYYLMQH